MMKHDVEIHWNPPGKNAKPMKVEATTLAYHETIAEIWLKPWGRMTRDTMVVEGHEVVVKLQDKVIRNITAIQASGNDDLPTRKLLYAADELSMDFDDDGLAQKINGNHNASLVSTTDTSQTTITGDRVDLNFQPDGNEAVLTQVAAAGNAVVTSKPLAVPGRQMSETHVLRSETLELKMRPGGREMESVVTKAPGTLEFLPNLPVQHHRTLDGQRLRDCLRPAEPPGQLPRDQREDADRPDGRRAAPQSRRRARPPAGNWRRASTPRPVTWRTCSRRAISPTRKATARRAPPKPPWMRTRT